jgi:chlorite dismutase
MDNISSHLPDQINTYISVRAQRLLLDKEAAALKETEEELKKAIVAKFREGGITAQGAANGLVKMTELEEPVATDWALFYEYVKQNDAWEMLHKRLTSTAIKEHWEVGESIPGVGKTTVYKLSVSGVKS